ncbi:MAG: Fe-only nitrogenase accessory AnfO family protein [Oscillospiraceae bacterium]|nr:Fe-only nitrogenase accessory AnfO family protein [Oscillospiraceae bacterium]MDD4367822.1 Fe-only nitrogenase accessory AnfO family protein [Oscillospiraceae bacterium]
MQETISILSKYSIPSSVQACQHVQIFTRVNGSWQLSQDIPWRLDSSSVAADIRDQIRSLVLELGDCRIIAAAELSGLPYYVFDRMGFAIFEITQIGDAVLDHVWADTQNSRNSGQILPPAVAPASPADAPASPADAPAAPAACLKEGPPGSFWLDLKLLQQQHPEISTKQALLPLLRQRQSFRRLTIIYSHLPPWLDQELAAQNLGYKSEAGPEGELIITIYHLN